MNKKILKSILIITLFMFCVMLNNIVFAAGSFTISKSSATITEGKTTTFSINGSSATGRVDITSSNSAVATVSSSSEWLENNSKTVTITAKKEGTATITISGTVADENGEENTITKTVKVTVKAKETTNTNKENNTTTTNKNNNTTTNKDTNNNTNSSTTTKTKSTNAYLSTLGVTPKEYDFSGFSKTKTSYSVTVPNDVDFLKVAYKTADSKATVKVSGNSGFEVGSNNTIKVVVTAEDGKTTKTYTIKVTKLAEEEEKPGNVIEDDDGLYLTSLKIEGIELSPEFSKDTYSYTAILNEPNINNLVVEAKANKENANIEISGNANLIEGENTVNIVLTLDDSSVQTVYQVVVTANFAGSVVNTDENTSNSNTDLIGTIKNYVGIAIAVIALMIVAVIVLIILLRRENKRLREEKDYENVEEYNVYKNNKDEFANKDNEANNFIESLYRQRNGDLYNEEELSENEKQTLEEINRKTDEIFRDKVQGQSVEYIQDDIANEVERPRRRQRGKHSM